MNLQIDYLRSFIALAEAKNSQQKKLAT